MHWLDGQLIGDCDPALAALRVPSKRPISCTTAHVEGGAVRHELRHLERLVRDAKALGLGDVDTGSVSRAWRELGQAVFGAGPGIIRIEVHPSADRGAARLLASPRARGEAPNTWIALACPAPHPGPGTRYGAKLLHFDAYEKARAYSAQFGVDESLLFDAKGRLVEGGRSNIIVVQANGGLLTPHLALGAVRGVGLAILLDEVAELEPAEIFATDLSRAQEVIAVNAVRDFMCKNKRNGIHILTAPIKQGF